MTAHRYLVGRTHARGYRKVQPLELAAARAVAAVREARAAVAAAPVQLRYAETLVALGVAGAHMSALAQLLGLPADDDDLDGDDIDLGSNVDLEDLWVPLAVDPDELIPAERVAEILGVLAKNVSNTMWRYDSFPRPAVAGRPGCSGNLWRAGAIWTWKLTPDRGTAKDKQDRA